MLSPFFGKMFVSLQLQSLIETGMEYCKTIIGRRHEQEILQNCYDSPKAEFVAVYGRRRIGKTYLVKQYFDEKFDFYATGVYQASRSEQLKYWQEQLRRHSGIKRTKPKDWNEAFSQLQDYLENINCSLKRGSN